MPGILVSTVLLAGVVALSPEQSMQNIRRILGFDDDRLGEVVEVSATGGQFAFSMTQPGSEEPVGYDPCRPIEVAVNPEGAPSNYEALVDVAIDRVSTATGLRFERVGETDGRDFRRVQWGVGARPPVLVAWATPDEMPDLAGDVAGVGGSTPVTQPGGRIRYVTGIVVLDRDLFATLGPEDAPHAQAIVDHEFAHLVGLGHVDDPGELMNEDNLGRTTYGPGDLEGLARLGAIEC